MEKRQQLHARDSPRRVFWAFCMTYLCIGLPLAVWGFIRVVERYERKKS